MSLADQQWCPTSVQVTVLQARGLRIKGKSGTNDAYAVMQVGKEKYQTSVVEKSVAPVWTEEASFDLPPLHQGGTERGTLHVHVLHRALVGPDKLLGQAVINLLQLSEDKTRNKTEWFKLLDKTGKPDKDRGEVLLDIQFMRNNMTASMFDLSAAGKSRSRLGKFKDKVRGKKKETDSASNMVPSFTQVLTDSEDEANRDGDITAGKEGKNKKHKMKSLFSPKSNLQRNMSQSMSVLPAKNSSLSSSQSSGLNVDSSEGKKKFKFMMHKRSGSSDSKDPHKQAPVEQSNLCINGSHIYCEEPQPRASRIGSNFSLASSGHGSMEDVPENSPPSLDSLRAVTQYSAWTEEEEEDVAEEENVNESRRMEDESMEEERRRKEAEKELEKKAAEERRQVEEERRAKEERQRQEEKERIRREEEKRRQEEERMKREEEKRRREEEERMKREEEKRRREEEERMKREEEKRRQEEERMKREEEKRRREEEERMKKEEEIRRQEEEARIRREEEKRRQEEERMKREEEIRRQVEEAERIKRAEEEEKKTKEEQRRLEEERARMEEARAEEERRKMLEEHQLAEEKRLMEEERIRKEEERRRREEEEKRQKEEEEILRRQEEEHEKKRKQEEERKKREEQEKQERLMEEERKRTEAEEKHRREEEEKIRVAEERRRKEEEEERVKRQKELEEKRRLEEDEKRRAEQEKMKLEEERIRKQEEYERQEERRRHEEEERIRKERIEEERRRQEEEEEKERKEKEEMERLAEMRREEREKKRIEEEERIRREERAERDRKEEEARRLKKERLTRQAEEQEKINKMRAAGGKSTVSCPAEVISTNPFDENVPCNPSESPTGPCGSSTGTGAQQRCQSGVSSVGSRAVSTDEKDLIGSQRERRPAPQPPGRNQTKTEQDVSMHQTQMNKQNKDKDAKTVSVLPVQTIAPLSRSPADNTTKGSTAKHCKRPAPSRPHSAEQQTSSASSDRVHYGYNPFEDDEDELPDDASNSEDSACQTKTKSSKMARAPLPPAVSASVAEGGCVADDVNEADKPQSEVQSPAKKVQEGPVKESQQNIVETSVKKEAPPVASRRLQPVKPLNPQEQQSVSGDVSGAQDKTKVNDTRAKGPYSQLTREELISLLLKQEKQLSERDNKISELEQYIDNLLVRVIEEQPSILMSLNSLKKAA